jgi:undecaprenyl phosphate-alpha-L-ara4FN deformylase
VPGPLERAIHKDLRIMRAGLRIDVDTFRGTRRGVPELGRILSRHGVRATFFFSIGPDNMGRHLRRLVRPVFFWKMMRSRAASLYGWDILLRGTLMPGPVIGEKLAPVIRAVVDAGHEVGVHAWDHHAWQTRIDKMTTDAIYDHLHRSVTLLADITGRPPTCSAAPAWKCNDRVLDSESRFPFDFNSDCRGWSIFRPVVAGREFPQPQVPVTLPTYDELIGRRGLSPDQYNDYLLSLLNPEKLNVLTIHAEVEGIACAALFERFLASAAAKKIAFMPLGDILRQTPAIDRARVVPAEIEGREGWVACQAPLESRN